jgi:HD-GYP domain-containing protein (c-di-GMP phosphodiesterase class II)
LQKPGPLSDEEMAIMKNAPSTAAKFLEPAKLLQKIAPIVETYHEHWDGSGYPSGLKGEHIPMEARVVSLIDAYVAMTSDRPYRKGLSKGQVIQEILSGSGTKWDARIVKIFLNMLNKESLAQTSEPAPAVKKADEATPSTGEKAAEAPTTSDDRTVETTAPSAAPQNGDAPQISPQTSEAAPSAQQTSD